jgi:tRNA G10  N-methylase Trm11
MAESMQSFALLGAHPSISLAEIHAVTGSQPSWHEGEFGVFDDVEWAFSDLQNRLGGVQKLGSIVGSITNVDTKELAAFVGADLIEQFPEGKVHVGVSVYGDDGQKVGDIRAKLKNLGFDIKTYLKDAGRSARYVISREPTLSSVVIKNNDLIKKGAEFVFIVRKNDILIGKTLAVQDVDVWSHRDMERPRRNAKQGMLPPKLARMMVNMVGGDVNGKTVLDPFCGSGTVLMEAGLLGAKKLIGGDIAPIAVEDSKANLNWIRAENPSMPEAELYVSKAADVASKMAPHSVDAIVTETYLGRPRKGVESVEDVQTTIEYVETLYRESFSILKTTLKKDGIVVLTAPFHVVEDETLMLDAVRVMTELGYTHLPTPFDPLMYRHQNQLVGRQILIFRA